MKDPDSKERSTRGGVVVGIHLGRKSYQPFRTHWSLLWGAIIAVIGIVLLLDNLGIISASQVFRFWPMILVAAGIINIAARSGRIFGIMLVVVGVLFQLDRLGLVRFSWGELIAIAMIGVGVLIMWSSIEARKIAAQIPGQLGDSAASATNTGVDAAALRNVLNEVAIFGGVERRITTKDFRGGSVNAVFGGVELDLGRADMQQPETELEINAIFGGVELRVPDNWQVVSRGQAIFGGYDDKTDHSDVDATGNPKKILILTGSAIFGGVDIKN
jgi:predicted membrane protein